MAKRKATRRAKISRTANKGRSAPKSRSAKRRPTVRARKAAARRPAKKAAKKSAARKAAAIARKAPQLDRDRRTLNDVVPTPPSSLDMDRHGSAARTGRAEIEQSRRQHGKMASVTSGDPDVNVDNAYFSGDEAPGGDNPTPDQDIVDDIGKALGVEYNDNEELRTGDKVGDRDKHRWELDPASSEDYRDRD
jgi:hypothetical protein